MKRMVAAVICLAVGQGLAVVFLLAFSRRDTPETLAASGSQPSLPASTQAPKEPAETAAVATRAVPKQAASPAPSDKGWNSVALPSMAGLERLRTADPGLRLSDAQQRRADEQAARFRRETDQALAGNRARQQELRQRLTDSTLSRVPMQELQKELAGLMVVERQTVADLDRQFRESLADILTPEQAQVIKEAVEGPSVPRGQGERAVVSPTL